MTLIERLIDWVLTISELIGLFLLSTSNGSLTENESAPATGRTE